MAQDNQVGVASWFCEGARGGVSEVDNLMGEARRPARDYRLIMGKPLVGIRAGLALHDTIR